MKKIDTEVLIKNLNDKGKYQVLVVVLICLINFGSSFIYEINPLMCSKPLVLYKNEKGEEIKEIINEEICQKYANSYKIVHFNNNWSFEFNFYCDNLKTSIMEQSLLIGNVVGLISLKFFPFPKETFYKFAQIIFCLSFSLIFSKNYWIIVIMNFIQGFTYYSCFIIKNMIITEMTSKSSRAKLFTIFYIVRMANPLSNPILYSLIDIIGWRYLFLFLCYFQIINLYFLLYYLKVNPIHYILANNMRNALKSAIFIARENSKIIEDKNIHIINNDDNHQNNSVLLFDNVNHISNFFTEKEFILWFKNLYFQNNLNQPEESETNIIYLSKKNFIFLGLLVIIGVLVFSCNYEKKYYTNDNLFTIVNIVTISAVTILIFPFIFIQDSKYFGRKGSILIIIIVILFTRIIDYLINSKITIIPFFINYSLNYLLAAIFHTFVSESFSNRERVKIYSILSIISKICVAFVPYIVEYFDKFFYNLIMIIYILVFIILLLFTKETQGLSLEN